MTRGKDLVGVSKQCGRWLAWNVLLSRRKNRFDVGLLVGGNRQDKSNATDKKIVDFGCLLGASNQSQGVLRRKKKGAPHDLLKPQSLRGDHLGESV
jgi:hypothetical protein